MDLVALEVLPILGDQLPRSNQWAQWGLVGLVALVVRLLAQWALLLQPVLVVLVGPKHQWVLVVLVVLSDPVAPTHQDFPVVLVVLVVRHWGLAALAAQLAPQHPSAAILCQQNIQHICCQILEHWYQDLYYH